MNKSKLLFGLLLALMIEIPFFKGLSKYVNMANAYAHAHSLAMQSPENANKPIVYIFYNDEPCETCPQAAAEAYDLVKDNFGNDVNIFEINYAAGGEENFEWEYHLEQPLSVVVVKMQDGAVLGYEKIDNPQLMLDNQYYFSEKIINTINDVLAV